MSGKIGWAVTGAGHLIKEIFKITDSLGNVDLFLSRAAEEVLKMYKINLESSPHKIYREGHASAPITGKFATGHYKGLIVAPATGNSVAKFVAGIADTLVTNIFAQAGKSRVPIIVFPTDVAPEMESMGPSKPVMVYPRVVDLDNTDKLADFRGVTVVRSIDDLKTAVQEMTG
ncbi:Archaeal flavoprotein COG1036 [hydrothermal vent metagenome]|uniref:Archaeal flavoprotein COG1036 n=1 Tax=hydrothermal vent metagenome TaxID=652676 RepID=A0A3B1CM85_9ZZZZ